MTRLFQLVKSLPFGLAALIALALPLGAQGEVPMPNIPEAQAQFSETQGCVEPVDEMRKNHMEYILHQRDETVRKGIRTRQYALEECINCHVPENTQVRADSPDHFCSSCHTYASVKIDCFQCHADRPVRNTNFHPLSSGGMPHHGDKLSKMEGLSKDTLLVMTKQGGIQP